MQQDVGELHVSVDNAKTLDIFEPLHDLLENAPSFFLKDLTAEFQENSQV